MSRVYNKVKENRRNPRMGRGYQGNRRRRTSRTRKLSKIGRIGLFGWTAVLVILFALIPNSREGQPTEAGAADELPLDVTDQRALQSSEGVTGAAQAFLPSGSSGPQELSLDVLGQLPLQKLPDGDALAFIKTTDYVVDKKGRLLFSEKRHESCDLPIITCAEVKVDPRRYRVTTEAVLEVLDFLDIARDECLPLYYRISQIEIDKGLGTVMYLEQTGLPVILGRGHCKRKVAYLATALDYIDGQDDLGDIKYLELRLDGQVVAKLAQEG